MAVQITFIFVKNVYITSAESTGLLLLSLTAS